MDLFDDLPLLDGDSPLADAGVGELVRGHVLLRLLDLVVAGALGPLEGNTYIPKY